MKRLQSTLKPLLFRGVFYALTLLIFSSCQEHEEADIILYNGKIYTVDSAFTVVPAMAVGNGKILAVGTDDSIRRNFRAPESIDLEGKVIFPGFNDAHAHFIGYAQQLKRVNLVGTESFLEVVQRTLKYAEEHKPEFIEGRGWDQNDWKVKKFPNKNALDSIFPEIPVVLKRIDGHAALVNQAALDYSGIDMNSDTTGGVVEKVDGKLTGILIDNAIGLLRFPESDSEELREAILWAQDSMFKYGVTSVTDAGLNLESINIIQSMNNAEILKVRINAMVSDKPELLDLFLKNGKIETDYLRVQCFKFYLDGALGSRGALMLDEYADDPGNQGLMLTSYEHLLESAKRLKENGWQMAVHAIGDSANRLVLKVYEEALDSMKLRWRVEHAQIVDPSDVWKFEALGVLPSVQPTHATSDMYWALDRIGEEKVTSAYPYKSLLESARTIPLGTDFPVEDIDPLRTYLAAVYRVDASGYPAGGFTPEECLTPEHAIRGMTLWGAFASFEEEDKGSLEHGKLADFVVLDQDLTMAKPDEVLKIKVLNTYVGGKMVYGE